VPDLYQGSELWDLSLVDPDNRGAVDFAQRVAALRAKEAPNSLAAHWRDALVKQALIHRALALRQERRALFARGSYLPVTATGPLAEHVVAFVRSHGSTHCLVVVPRLPRKLLPDDDTISIPTGIWDRTTLQLPHEVAGAKLRDAVNGGCVGPLGGGPLVGDVLRGFPVALLTSG
jgi:(1->4)-alpha-D-glucan 1-alpha-D-glucosylmutase